MEMSHSKWVEGKKFLQRKTREISVSPAFPLLDSPSRGYSSPYITEIKRIPILSCWLLVTNFNWS